CRPVRTTSPRPPTIRVRVQATPVRRRASRFDSRCMSMGSVTMAVSRKAGPLGLPLSANTSPFGPLNSPVWFRWHLAKPSSIGCGGKASRGTPGPDPRVESALRSLPVTPRPKIPKPEDGPGKLHPLYVQTPQAPDGFVGLDFHFEPVPFGRYHWLKVT